MTDIINTLNTITRNANDSYQTLAQKAVRIDSSKTGVAATLERFFHKLEFLLKYGYLPSTKDTNGSRLPSELQGLKAFLEHGKMGDSFVLQRNATERYRFSKQDGGKLTVNTEILYVPVAAVRSGYTGADTWRMKTNTENVDADSVLQVLNGQKAEKTSQSGLASETLSVTNQNELAAMDDTDSSDSSTTENVDADSVLQVLNRQKTETTSQSGPVPETLSATDQNEPVVIDDTDSSDSSAGRVEDCPPVSPGAASFSVASAAPQFVQQPPQADQNEVEQPAASAEQPSKAAKTMALYTRFCNLFPAEEKTNVLNHLGDLLNSDNDENHDTNVLTKALSAFQHLKELASEDGKNKFYLQMKTDNYNDGNLFTDFIIKGETVMCYSSTSPVILSGAELSGANMQFIHLDGANLDGASMNGTHLKHAYLPHASMIQTNLERACMICVYLDGANLDGANLNGAILRNAILRNAILSYASLNGANLNGAILRNAILSYASLNGANLNGANLNGASLNGADLRNTELGGARLDDTNLSKARMSGAKYNGITLTQENINIYFPNATGLDSIDWS